MRFADVRNQSTLDGARRSGRGRGAFPPNRHPPKTSRMARLQALDDRLLRSVIRLRRSPLTLLMRTLCRLHDPDSLIMLITALVLLGPAGSEIASHAIVALLVTSVVVVAVKRTVRRTRPALEVQAHAPPDRFSFPSGHTAAAFAIALSMFGAAPLLVPILVGVATLVGWARIYLGVHYPMDVLAGVCVGVFTGSVVALLPVMSLGTFLNAL
jgi:undecaprenyl-diphosphatase